MTAGTANLVIYKGGAFSNAITLYATGTTTPINPGTGGIAAAGTNPDAPALVFTVSTSATTPYTTTLTATPEQTAALKLGTIPWAYMSADGTVYVQGTAEVTFTPVKYVAV